MYTPFFELIEEHLKKVYTDNLQPRELYEPQQYILSLGGKRLRPLLALIGADLFEGKVEKAIHAALAVELFHNFSLIHDDILDKAPLRRNQQTVHVKWNTDIAILSGDAMLVKAIQVLAKSDTLYIPDLLNLFNKTAIEVCEGQQEDMNFETRNAVSVAEYEEMIRKKTAVLLACSLEMGAITAGAKKEDAEHLYKFGEQLGIAFQLKDDILDVYSEQALFGKQEAGDIISNKKTFLLLKASELSDATQSQELKAWIDKKEFVAEEKVKAVKKIYGELNIKELAEEEVQRYYAEALLHLDNVNCSKTKKENFKQFCASLMERMK